MTKQPLSVTEMFSSIMELLEQAGYAKHTLWGKYVRIVEKRCQLL